MRREALAVLIAGVALAASFPKVDAWPLVWVSLAPLVVAATRVGPARALALGALYGFAAQAATMYWVVYAMTHFGGLTLPLAILAATGLVGYLALYPALFALVARSAPPTSLAAAVLLAATWTGLDALRGWLFTGFPWELLGYAAGRPALMAQGASLFGVHGLGFVAALFNVGVAAAVITRPRNWRPLAASAGVVMLLLAYGAVVLISAPVPGQATGREGSLRVGLVQGNVPQDLKWDPSVREEVLERHFRLTIAAADAGARVIFWPESSWPDAWGLERDVYTLGRLQQIARERDVELVIGTVHVDEVGVDRLEVTNAAVLIDGDGALRGRYDKSHLVPFGEYLPFRGWLGFLGPLVQAVGELRAGEPDQELLAAPDRGLPPFGLSICYEIIFPGIARSQVLRGAGFLATITNDAWYGTTSGPYQHFSMARMRAVELRRPLVRAANTGISGVFDPWGRVVSALPLGQEGIVVAEIVPGDVLTPYSRIGDVLAWICAAIALFGCGRALFGRAGPGRRVA